MRGIFLDKNGQVAKTVTWIVATIIIIVILGITLFVADITWGGSKDVSQTTQVDLLASKSFFSYLLTPHGQENWYLELGAEEDLSAIDVEFAKEIFQVYGKDYPAGIFFIFSRESRISPGIIISQPQTGFTRTALITQKIFFYNQRDISKSITLSLFK